MQNWIKRTACMIALSLSGAGSALALEETSENEINKAVSVLMETVNNSPEFNQMMACIGIKGSEKVDFLSQYETAYRGCLTDFPVGKDEGVGFVQCWQKASSSPFKALGIEESVLKKCSP